MITAALAFGSAVAVSAALTPRVRSFAKRAGAIDLALSSRKVHVAPIPRLGGLAIVAGFLVPVIALVFLNNSMARELAEDPRAAVALILGGLSIAALGAYDDIHGSDAKLKFLVQFAVATMAYALGLRIDHIAMPFGPPIALGLLGMPFTVFFIVGIVNAINLIDGLDGLAGGVALIAVVTSFVAAALNGDVLMMVITAALAGSILGFLFYNFNPASIFMGDTGSLFLGYVLAVSAIKSHEKTNMIAIAVPLIAMGLPVADTLLAILRRAARGLPLFRGDKEHIHHKLLAMGLSHRRVVLVLYAVATILGITATLLSFLQGAAALALLATLAVSGGVFLRKLGFLPVERTAEVIARRRRNLNLRRMMSDVHERLQAARDVESVWQSLQAATPLLGATWAGLQVVLVRDGRRETVHFVDGRRPPERAKRTRHGLYAEKLERGYLELAWPLSDSSVSRDIELAVEILCVELHDALERVMEMSEASTREIAIVQQRAAGDVERHTSRPPARVSALPAKPTRSNRPLRLVPSLPPSEPNLDIAESAGE